ncbi:MAG: S9 family peptidase, partial [Bacteroidetes bacterium]|nr:S9 family peptidase [Bacteroidota bacterium]
MSRVFRSLTLVILIGIAAVTSTAQEPKKSVTPEDYTKWSSLGSATLSDDGKWLSWSIRMVDSDDSLFVKNIAGTITYRYFTSSALQFSSDSKWAAMRIGYSEKETEQMTEQKKPIKFKVRLLNLTEGAERVFSNIESFSFSRDASHLIMNGYAGDRRTRDIYLLHLASGRVKNIGNISESSVNRPGTRLAYIVDAEDKKGNGVEILNLADYTITFIDNDTAKYRSLVWEREGNALAFMKEYSDTSFTEPNFRLYAVRYPAGKTDIKVLNPAGISAIPPGMRISENYRLSWSKDMKTLFFGVFTWTPKPLKGKNDKPSSSKLPGLDIWHWKDDPIQPRQKVTYNTDNNFTYLFAWNIDAGPVVRITDDELTRATITGDGRHALAMNTTLYRPAFRDELFDYYLINTLTGERKKLLEQFSSVYGSSPDGKYILYFRDKNWWVYDIYKASHKNLTEKVPSVFWNTRDDSPRDVKPPFGIAGWLKEDRALLVYDEYDAWRIPADGSTPVRLTQGKETGTILRITRLETEDNFIDPLKDLYFSAFGDTDKKSGYLRVPVKGKPGLLIYDDRSVTGLSKAKNSETFLFRSETYAESPNLFTTGYDFRAPVKQTSTNPHQKDYEWGRSELVKYKNVHGQDLEGALFYPANYEPGKKYPMIVYIYEIRSNMLHRYVTPSQRSAYNTTNFTTQGYFVYQPDIVYRTNHPGESAVECVVPAVEAVLRTGMIDRQKIGIMGHSWGAYQASFIITQTDLFSAAVAGAPLINMISMYNEIYWNSGSPNQNIFETSQGRLREPWWEIMDEYMANSPMFQAKNIGTPLLVAFGTQDGAVDWHQGIEMFTTMRRMQKPYIMLVYDGENHSLAKKENQTDYARKVNEFFNHHLLGSEAPEWIVKGKSYLEKRREE